jgi:L-threonylcarbamoyladenylate synthase
VKTQVLATATPEELETAVTLAVDHLQRGEIVALPTETVYGLAADALNIDAALKIFEAKERPRFDPLIVHLPDHRWLDRLTSISSEDDKLARSLIANFWPGPLTLVLRRREVVPDVVTAGLETVAVRMSAHPVFSAIVRRFERPLAAPSANRFGRISPTTAQHVVMELEGRVGLVVDAGATTHGVESTIVAVRNGRIEILRHGPITVEQLREFAEVQSVTASARVEAPGQLRSHYAPRTPLVLTRNICEYEIAPGARAGALSFGPHEGSGFAEIRTLSSSRDLREAATNLFRYLRELDDLGLGVIVAEELPEEGLGTAIMDRLRRAAAR